MKYIKTFEEYEPNNYINDNDLIRVNDIMSYLGVDVDIDELDEEHPPKSKYGVDIVDFFKEILLNKNISFKSVNTPEHNPIENGTVSDVKLFSYKEDLYIEVKLSDSDWIIINNYISIIIDYDAQNKPLHKEVKRKKEAEKYNL